MDNQNKINIPGFEMVFEEALKSEPDFLLPADFAEQLSAKLGKQAIWRQYVQEFLTYLIVFAIIAGLSIAAVFWIDGRLIHKIATFIMQQYFLIIGLNLLLVFILFADKVLLRYFYFRINEKHSHTSLK